MTREEKELLLKDLSARLPYRVKVRISSESDGHLHANTTTLDIDNLHKFILDGGYYVRRLLYKIQNFQLLPYLRPMSSMTEEEQQKYYDLTHQEDDDIWGKCLFDKMVDFCNENHLDYRGLIEKGLALEAPTDMYKV